MTFPFPNLSLPSWKPEEEGLLKGGEGEGEGGGGREKERKEEKRGDERGRDERGRDGTGVRVSFFILP